MRNYILKSFAFLLAVLMIAGCVYTLITSNRENASFAKSMQDTQIKIDALKKQEKALKKEVTDAKNLLNINERSKAENTILLTFQTATKELYEEVYPIMKQNNVCGIIVFKAGALPGDKTHMTVEQVKEMVEDGWEVAISSGNVIDVTSNQSKDCEKMKKYLQKYLNSMESKLGFRPGVVYFNRNWYRPGYDEVVASLGINLFMLYDDTGTLVSSDNTEENEMEVFHLIAVENILTALSTGTSQKKLAVTMDLSESASTYESYSSDKLRSILSKLKDYSDQEELVVAAPHIISKNSTLDNSTETELQERLKKAQDELSVVQQKIRELYK